MRLVLRLLRPIYFLLYHHFAWSYDLVAALVSLGYWQKWVLSVLPRLQGRVLEIGFGPGHLQLAMRRQGLEACGLDESRFMARQAARQLRAAGFPVALVRGYAQLIPFPSNTFDTLVATFPAEYIFDDASLVEFRRVLRPGGRLVILPTAWFEGGKGLERVFGSLSRLLGGAAILDRFLPAFETYIARHNFELEHEVIPLGASRVLVLTAVKRARRVRKKEAGGDFG